MSHGVKNISLGCGVRPSLMLFYRSEIATLVCACIFHIMGSFVVNSGFSIYLKLLRWLLYSKMFDACITEDVLETFLKEDAIKEDFGMNLSYTWN